jgi:hypothetical protein
VVADAAACAAHERDPLGEEASGDEAQDLGRGLVEPLRVVHDADERLPVGDLGEQRQRREPDEKPIRRRAVAPAEHGGERLALRVGERVEAIQHRPAKLVQAAVGQLHLRLCAHRPDDVPAGDTIREVAEQRALADPGLAA